LLRRRNGLQGNHTRPARIASEQALDFRRLVMERGPPLAGGAREENEAHRAGVMVGAAAEPLGNGLYLVLASLGIVQDHEQAVIVAVRDEVV